MDTDPPCSPASVLVFITALVSGTALALLSKTMMELEVSNSDDEVVVFKKPLSITFSMFAGMILALPLHGIVHILSQGVSKPLPLIKLRMVLLLALTATTDLLGTSCSMMGLLFVKVSTQQLVRSSVIVFVCLYKKVLGMQKFGAHQYLGIALNVCAILAVGSSALVDGSGAAGGNVPLGIAWLVLGCAIMAAQYVIEEVLLKLDEAPPPLLVIGTEGAWGAALMLCVVFPLAARAPGADYGGCYESLADTLAMLRHADNEALRGVAGAYIGSVASYNVMSIFITLLLGAMWRSIFMNFRPGVVWLTDLAIYYVVLPGSGFGEVWTPWSWLQLGGMCVLLAGTAVYQGSLVVPGFEPPDSAFQKLVRHPSLEPRSPMIEVGVLCARELRGSNGQLPSLVSPLRGF